MLFSVSACDSLHWGKDCANICQCAQNDTYNTCHKQDGCLACPPGILVCKFHMLVLIQPLVLYNTSNQIEYHLMLSFCLRLARSCL